MPAPGGTIDATFTTLDSGGPWPGVLMLPDAMGPRPAVFGMAERLAQAGYAVLVPNAYYRNGPAPVVNTEPDFNNPDDRAEIMKVMATLTPERVASDGRHEIDWLTAQPQVAGGKVGVVGYCMGGGMAMRVAAAAPGQVGAVAAYHGGFLATDAPESPHRLLPQIKAELYFGHAEDDETMNAAAIDRLEKALKDAGSRYRSELYPGSVHGFAVPGPRHDKPGAERHWATMTALFDRALACN